MNIKDYIAEYPHFPKTGILFKDISPLLSSPKAYAYVCHEIAQKCQGVDKIVALDARGFIFAPMVSQILGVPWIMARKAGKLPGEVSQISYDLEYGSNTIEIQTSSIQKGEKIGIIDDLLATGGTAMAAVKLVEKLGGQLLHIAFVIALNDEFLCRQAARRELEGYNYSALVEY